MSCDKEKNLRSGRKRAYFSISLGLKIVFKSSETSPHCDQIQQFICCWRSSCWAFQDVWKLWVDTLKVRRCNVCGFLGNKTPHWKQSESEPEPKWQRVYVNGTERGLVIFGNISWRLCLYAATNVLLLLFFLVLCSCSSLPGFFLQQNKQSLTLSEDIKSITLFSLPLAVLF